MAMRIILVWLVGVLTLAGGTLAESQESGGERGTTLRVSGRGSASRAPDVAEIVLGAEAYEETVEAAQAKVNAAINAARDGIVALGVPKAAIRTASLRVWSVYESKEAAEARGESKPQKIIGFRATTSLGVRLDDVAMCGKVIDTAIKAGVTELDRVRFGLRDDTEEKRIALTHAVKQARAKADAIAVALGVEIVGVLEVVDETGWSGGSSPFSADTETEVEVGEVVVTAEVEIRFEIAPPGRNAR